MSTGLIELGLLKGPPTGDRRRAAAWLAERLLGLIVELPIKTNSSLADDYRARLELCRARLCGSAPAELAAAAAEECFKLCRDYLESAALYLSGRESELNEAIRVLQGVVAELASESGDFRRRLNDSTEALGRLTEIRDIGELRRLLSQEVGRLKSALVEKQRREEEVERRMSRQIEGLRTKLTKAEVEASLDALTGIANRRAFDDEIKHWIGRVRAGGNSFCVALVDLDDFKQVNDTYGHPAGDVLLRGVAQLLKSNFRSTDLVARYGGEEFVVLLENITLEWAEVKMAGVLSRLASTPFDVADKGPAHAVHVTASCGLALCGESESQWDLIMRTDGALYEAKRRGKNRCVVTW